MGDNLQGAQDDPGMTCRHSRWWVEPMMVPMEPWGPQADHSVIGPSMPDIRTCLQCGHIRIPRRTRP